MDLYIVRHAWAGHFGDPQWPNDAERPLTEEGKRRFARVVQRLVEGDFAPQIVATSPLVRCRQTAEILAAGVPTAPEVVERGELQPGGELIGLLVWTGKQARRWQQIAWVGHAPDVGRLAAELIGQPDGNIHFSKAAIAAICFEGPPEAGHGELRWLITPKLLGC
jgi:phosphohistidine phosphatase